VNQGRWSSERGGGGVSLSWALVMSAAIALIFAGVQFGLHGYAQSLALAAAQTGVRAATANPVSVDRGEQAARDYLSNEATVQALRDSSVTVTLDGDTVTVLVTGVGIAVVPGMNLQVSESASGRTEEVTS
jgi:Flp pilus assembly protein TadG